MREKTGAHRPIATAQTLGQRTMHPEARKEWVEG